MVKRSKKAAVIKVPKDKLLAKFTIFFFERPVATALLWILLTLFGTLSYTTLMRREGFPSVTIPLTFVGGTYFVNDPAKVDSDVAAPISRIALEQEGVSTVQAQSSGNFFTISIAYDEGVDANAAAAQLEKTVQDSGALPKTVIAQYNVPYFGATGGDVDKLDVAISFYPLNEGTPITEIVAKASEAANWLNDKKIHNVAEAFIKNPFEDTVNPATGKAISVQRSFDRYGKRDNSATTYHQSVIIGLAAVSNADVIKLDKDVRTALEDLGRDERFSSYGTEITASFAPQIKDNISELQRVLLEGLIAVLVVGSIVIAVRASLITVISMVTVLAITLGFLYAIGYSLNVITLFALILALALIVDDTIIMVEAIDAARHHHKDRKRAVKEAIQKVSRAMVAATTTAALSFAPFLFVGGVLGSFIKAIPITIIAALFISLLVALIFIPFFARELLLGKKQMGKKGVKEVAAGFEANIANFFAGPMLWARNSRKRLLLVGMSAIAVGTGFVVAGALIGRNVVFNIFPPTKDTNGVVLSISFPPDLSIEQAEQLAAEADKLAANTLGENYVQGSYFASGSPQGAMQQIELISYNKRDIRSPELVKQLQEKFNNEFTAARVAVGQLDVGPPAASFIVEIRADNRQAAFTAAHDMATFLRSKELTRPNGKTARLVNVTESSSNQYIRDEGKPIVTVSAGFDANDTSTLVSLGQTAIKDEFTPQKLASYGLAEDAVSVDLGQESENQDSFKTLALAFPILLLIMYILLSIQFRSLLQPLLIFMAIPFSLFGITFGLNLTNNPFSFFAMLGFFALLGLSIKNTILLTDFANQARRQNLSAVDSAVAALRERFRPLFATSATAVVALIPL
ncbi:efflux RND transporter permease subunit, partial [Candidatus Saccharibacteria bacterium]|nr:efflux RND transporter permease subunit [Candidatus Saccharibacteria bacterium]